MELEYLKKIDRQLSRMQMLDPDEAGRRAFSFWAPGHQPVLPQRTKWLLPKKRVMYFHSDERDVLQRVLCHSDELWLTLCQLPLVGLDAAGDTGLYDEMTAIADVQERQDFLFVRHPELLCNLEAAYEQRQTNADYVKITPAFVAQDFDNLPEETRNGMLRWFFTNPLLSQSVLFITAGSVMIPDAYTDQVELFHIGLPSAEDVLETLVSHMENLGCPPNLQDEDIQRELTSASRLLTGFTFSQIEDVLFAFTAETGAPFYTCIPGKKNQDRAQDLLSSLVRAQKEEMSSKDPLLTYEFCHSAKGISPSDGYRSWLDENIRAFKDAVYACYKGRARIKGVIMAGLPGTGKSLLARYTACRLEIPMFTFRLSDLQDKYVGGSGKNLKKYLDRIDANAPCLLFVDEVEKYLSVTATTHETTTNMVGQLLSWMQKNESVFCYFTANDISNLRPELLRVGRISGHYFCFLPSGDELGGILYAQLKRICDESLEQSTKLGLPPLYDAEFRRLLSDEAAALEAMKALAQRISPVPGGEASADDWRKKPLFFTGSEINNLILDTNMQLDKTYRERMEYSREEFEETFLRCALSATCSGVSSMDVIVDTWLSMKEKGYSDAAGKALLPAEQFGAKGFENMDWLPDKDKTPYDYHLALVVGENIQQRFESLRSMKEAQSHGH